jgi:hypothetical protein
MLLDAAENELTLELPSASQARTVTLLDASVNQIGA